MNTNPDPNQNAPVMRITSQLTNPKVGSPQAVDNSAIPPGLAERRANLARGFEKARQAQEAQEQEQFQSEAAETSAVAEASFQGESPDSVLLEMPNGKIVEFGPARGASATVRLIRLFGDAGWTSQTAILYRVLMSVRMIDNVAVKPIKTREDGERLIEQIGDDGIEVLFKAQQRFWPVDSNIDRLVLKKNLPRS